MTLAAGIALIVIAVVSVVAVIGVFVWAAKKDGEEQRARDRDQGPPV